MADLMVKVRLPLMTPQFLADRVAQEELVKTSLRCRYTTKPSPPLVKTSFTPHQNLPHTSQNLPQMQVYDMIWYDKMVFPLIPPKPHQYLPHTSPKPPSYLTKTFLIPHQNLPHTSPKPPSYLTKNLPHTSPKLPHTQQNLPHTSPGNLLIPHQNLPHTSPKPPSYLTKASIIPHQNLCHTSPKPPSYIHQNLPHTSPKRSLTPHQNTPHTSPNLPHTSPKPPSYLTKTSLTPHQNNPSYLTKISLIPHQNSPWKLVIGCGLGMSLCDMLLNTKIYERLLRWFLFCVIWDKANIFSAWFYYLLIWFYFQPGIETCWMRRKITTWCQSGALSCRRSRPDRAAAQTWSASSMQSGDSPHLVSLSSTRSGDSPHPVSLSSTR